MDLIWHLIYSYEKLSYSDIEKIFGCSRRTAERMMAAVQESEWGKMLKSEFTAGLGYKVYWISLNGK